LFKKTCHKKILAEENNNELKNHQTKIEDG